jgi:uncharacterized membrane protein
VGRVARISRSQQDDSVLNRLPALWDAIRTSLWILPAAMFVSGVGLAAGLLAFESGQDPDDRMRFWFLYAGGAVDARNLLSTLLTSMITMASIVFSVTVVALTLAANQYGSRLSRVIRADVRTQFTLGIFVMTIVYILIVLRSIHGEADDIDVPHLSVTVGTALGLVCVLTLLVFIQGIAQAMVADEVVKRAAKELDRAVQGFPLVTIRPDPDDARADLPQDFDERARSVAVGRDGYIQSIDYEAMADWAKRNGAIIRLEIRPGEFIAEGDRPLSVCGGAETGEWAKDLLGMIVIGDEQTPTQDVEFAVRHLVEVAVRALSPGINDPYTAISVIDRIRGSLTKVTGRRLPSGVIRDDSGRAIIVRKVTGYGDILDAALHQIRQAGSRHPAVMIHLLEAIGRIAAHARLEEQRQALAHHAGLVWAAVQRDVAEPADRRDAERSFRRAMQGARGSDLE